MQIKIKLMNRRGGVLLKCFLLSIFLLNMLFSLPKIKELLMQVDENQTLSQDLTGRIELLQKQVRQGVRKIEMVYYRRDKDDSFLIVMLNPNVEKGNGYLKVEDNFWAYRKNTRTFQHINRDESIGGTDINSGDLEQRKYTELYEGVISNQQEVISKERLGKINCYRFEIKAVEEDVTYPKQTIWVRQDNSAILRVENYSATGKHMLSQYYTKYTKIKGKLFLLEGRNIDRFEKGNATAFKISDVSLKEIKDNIFTKAYLENLSR